MFNATPMNAYQPIVQKSQEEIDAGWEPTEGFAKDCLMFIVSARAIVDTQYNKKLAEDNPGTPQAPRYSAIFEGWDVNTGAPMTDKTAVKLGLGPGWSSPDGRLIQSADGDAVPSIKTGYGAWVAGANKSGVREALNSVGRYDVCDLLIWPGAVVEITTVEDGEFRGKKTYKRIPVKIHGWSDPNAAPPVQQQAQAPAAPQQQGFQPQGGGFQPQQQAPAQGGFQPQQQGFQPQQQAQAPAPAQGGFQSQQQAAPQQGFQPPQQQAQAPAPQQAQAEPQWVDYLRQAKAHFGDYNTWRTEMQKDQNVRTMGMDAIRALTDQNFYNGL